MSDVLAKHRFSIPWIGVRGPDDSMWFISERFQSKHQFDRIYVQVTPDERVTAIITGYQQVGSSWAISRTYTISLVISSRKQLVGMI